MKKLLKKYWWLGILLIPVILLISSIRIRKVKTINWTEKGIKLSAKGTIKRNSSNTGYMFIGKLIKTSSSKFTIGQPIIKEFLDKDNNK